VKKLGCELGLNKDDVFSLRRTVFVTNYELGKEFEHLPLTTVEKSVLLLKA